MNIDMECPYLIRNDDSELETNGEMSEYPKMIYLNKNKITIGRSPNVDCCILSQNVSRVHAIIKSMNGEWCCTDHNSSNGVCINGHRIRAGVPTPMRSGDVICIGYEVEPINLFTFRGPSIKRGCDESGGDSLYIVDEVKKRSKQTESSPIKESSHEERLRRKNETLEAEIERLKKENEEKMRMKEKAFESKNAEDARLFAVFETQLMESKESLRSTIMEMGGIKERMNRLLLAKKRADKETIVEKSKLQSALLEKEKECKALEEMLNKIKAKRTQQSSQMGNDLTTVLTNILDAELQCSVCNELFVKATTLQCSHTFCTHCITEWCKKKNDCPICRKPVAMFAPTLVLDGYIDKVIDVLSPELKSRRLEMIAEKNQSKENQAAGASFTVAAVAAASAAAAAGPSRRSNRLTQWVAAAAGIRDGTRAEGAIEILTSDESSDNDDFGFSDADSFGDANDGLSEAYYGGYGHCYVCGQRGHWANGCPYR